MIADNTPLVLCPICKAENRRESAYCFLCGQSLVGAEAVAAKPLAGVVTAGVVTPDAAPRQTFRLNSMMLLIALIAVFLGLANEAPGLAVVLAIPALIALVRTVMVSGHRDSWFNHVAVFVATFTALLVIVIAGVVAFFATCLAIVSTGEGNYGGDHLPAGLVIGGLVGLGVAILLAVVFIRKGRRRRDG